MSRQDVEMEEMRDLMRPPGRFDEGFSWVALAGAVFIGLLMVPGAIYMQLVSGQDVGGAARWVTVILFLEIARRTQKTLKRAEIFVLFYMAAAATAVPFESLLFRQFFVQSNTVLANGWTDQIPQWYAPTNPDVLAQRSFLVPQWLPAIAMIILFNVISRIDSRIVGFGLFKVASDLERLPFPMAPITAQGIVALAEEDDDASWRWRSFAIGGAIGLLFGVVYLGVPILSNAVFGVTLQALPIPFVDWTASTQSFLPAVPTGFSFDLTHFFLGMVMPWWAIVGGAIGLAATFIFNPVLYRAGVLHSWNPGDSTIPTLFKNTVDFYFSFGIGLSLAIAAVGFASVAGSVRRAKAQAAVRDAAFGTPPDRGNIPNWAVIGVYVASCLVYIGVAGYLIDWHRGVMTILFVYAFVYTPVISYVTARLEGMVGQALNIPLAREAGIILSGYQGLKVWFLPIPISNYGEDTVFYRTAELTGTRFWSVWKADMILVPFILVCSIFFANFIWTLAPIPSQAYPYTQQVWELHAMNQGLVYSATTGQREFSQFSQAFNAVYIACGMAFGLIGYLLLAAFGLPTLIFYGFVRGMNQSMPHSMWLSLLGACLGRFYFQPRFGKLWRQYIPVVAAGFSCGMGLVAVLCIGVTFLSKAVTTAPY